MKVTQYLDAIRTRADGAMIEDAWIERLVRYFEQTDTLLIEFRDAVVTETPDLDENTLLDLDRNGNICAITVEHVSKRTDIPKFSFERVTA